jgi:hypothetical protein
MNISSRLLIAIGAAHLISLATVSGLQAAEGGVGV